MISESWWKSMDNILTYVICAIMMIVIVAIIVGSDDY